MQEKLQLSANYVIPSQYLLLSQEVGHEGGQQVLEPSLT